MEVGLVESAVDGPTIVDVLNEDCWRFVFDYISINELFRSERVSRGWRLVVRRYLRRVQNFRIEFSTNVSKVPERYLHYRKIVLTPHKAPLKDIIRKLGPFIVRLESNCIDDEGTHAITRYCRRLEALTLSEAHLQDILTDVIPDDYSADGSIDPKLRCVTGSFLRNLRSKLKSLSLTNFRCLLIGHLQLSLKHLAGLTRLELNAGPLDTLENISSLLNVMPNLEHLCLMDYERYTEFTVPMPVILGHLKRLRELHLWGNEHVTDDWLLAVARGCPLLRVLNIGLCIELTPSIVVTVCEALPTLTELVVSRLHVTDDQLEACARLCPDLQYLDAGWCTKLTKGVLKRIAWPREHPLQLRMRGTAILRKSGPYEGIDILWDLPHDPYNPLRMRFDDADSVEGYARCDSECGSVECDHGSLVSLFDFEDLRSEDSVEEPVSSDQDC